jgi:hypothetical protein
MTAASSGGSSSGSTGSSSADALTLRISEDTWKGDAQFTVSVDGKQVGGTLTASALHATGNANVFVLNGNWAAGSHQVAIQFLNDAWGGTTTTDRNLYVDSIAYNGKTESGTTASLMSNGTKTFTVSSTAATVSGPADTVTVHLAEDAYNGNAQFKLLVGAGGLGARDGRGAGVRMDLQHRSDLPLSGLDQTVEQVAVGDNSMPHRIPTMFRDLTVTTTAGFARYLWWEAMPHGDASRCASLGRWPGRRC